MPAQHGGCARSASEGQAKVRPAFPPGKPQHQPCHGAGTALCVCGTCPWLLQKLSQHSFPCLGKSLPGHTRSLTNLQQYLDIWDFHSKAPPSSPTCARKALPTIL